MLRCPNVLIGCPVCGDKIRDFKTVSQSLYAINANMVQNNNKLHNLAKSVDEIPQRVVESQPDPAYISADETPQDSGDEADREDEPNKAPFQPVRSRRLKRLEKIAAKNEEKEKKAEENERACCAVIVQLENDAHADTSVQLMDQVHSLCDTACVPRNFVIAAYRMGRQSHKDHLRPVKVKFSVAAAAQSFIQNLKKHALNPGAKLVRKSIPLQERKLLSEARKLNYDSNPAESGISFSVRDGTIKRFILREFVTNGKRVWRWVPDVGYHFTPPTPASHSSQPARSPPRRRISDSQPVATGNTNTLN